MQCAVTRGDGVIGDDITTNAKKMNGVMIAITKHGVPVDFTGGIRGEVIMTHDVHKNYFADKENISTFALPILGQNIKNHLQWLTFEAIDSSSSYTSSTVCRK